MTRLKAVRPDVLLALVTAGLALGAVAVRLASYLDDHPYHLPVGDYSVELLESLLFGGVGLLIAMRRPGHAVGVALLLTAVGIGGYTFFGSYADLALATREGTATDVQVSATGFSAIWPLIVGGMFFLILLFPTGKVPSRAFGALAGVWLVAAAAEIVAYFLLPGLLEPPYEQIDSPLAVESLRSLQPFTVFFAAIILGSTAAAGVNLLLRFRRSRGVEREQFRWMLFSGLLVIPATVLTAFPSLEPFGSVLQVLAFVGFPISVGIAILRYRLYDIDRIINRTLVYGLLTATLAALYFGLVVGLQALLAPLSGSSDLAIALTTLAVAALFLPARSRIQAIVDRRFNRRAYNAALTVEAFSSRLREEIDLDTLRYELLAVLDETMQPAGASLWLRPQGQAR